MSMMYCYECSRLVDTDFDLDGLWAGFDYVCESCCEDCDEHQLLALKEKYENKALKKYGVSS